MDANKFVYTSWPRNFVAEHLQAPDMFLNSTGLCHQNIEKYFSRAPLFFMYYTVLLQISPPPLPPPRKNFNLLYPTPLSGGGPKGEH